MYKKYYLFIFKFVNFINNTKLKKKTFVNA